MRIEERKRKIFYRKKKQTNMIDKIDKQSSIYIMYTITLIIISLILSVDPESVRSGIKKLWFQVFLNFTPWVDTFFLISGLLVCYGGLNSFEKIHTRITDDQSMIQSIGNFVKTISSSIAHRYWR